MPDLKAVKSGRVAIYTDWYLLQPGPHVADVAGQIRAPGAGDGDGQPLFEAAADRARPPHLKKGASTPPPVSPPAGPPPNPGPPVTGGARLKSLD